MKIEIIKKTDKSDLLNANEATFRGKSNMSLRKAYLSEHSPVRTQVFWITMENIPLSVAMHLVRHKHGVEPFVLTLREDRGGFNFKKWIKGWIDSMREYDQKHISLIESGRIKEAADIECERETMYNQLHEVEKKIGRNTPTNLALWINAQALINISKERLCLNAERKTVDVYTDLKNAMFDVDPELYDCMVKKCVYRNGICPEQDRSCGFIKTKAFKTEQEEYLSLFVKQK